MTQLVTPTMLVLQHEPYPERWQEADPDKRGVRAVPMYIWRLLFGACRTSLYIGSPERWCAPSRYGHGLHIC